ncbi:hypothetical protein [Paeniglutamicibacter cryotolerans]|uniref:Uncharacterized protein n=1 Tax=Paeniglutamicibacter cryotolerans TaxID=670079 RepID=A0A839QLG1_9MICC|nr:hypothetical protein [Paeniglutamicibacter cryotolerans]MBB2997059.1 hypothetical protein [Paeniglutamicibacter cryotolerans]
MKSFPRHGCYLSAVTLDWVLGVAVAVVAILYSSIGSHLAGRIPGAALRKGCGRLVLALVVFVLFQELHPLRASFSILRLSATVFAAAVVLRWFVVP